MSTDQSSPVDNIAVEPSGADAMVNLGEMLDGKFKVLTILEADVDSFTLEALRVSDERAVIVRLLKPAAAAHKVISERFKSEANKLQLLVHHNVPRCTQVAITESGQPYAVLAYFRGYNLRQILNEESSLRIERAINIACQICAALTGAHRLGIVEHNLSPRNIYLSKVHNGLEVVRMPGVGFVETPPALGDTFMHGTQNLVQNDSIVYKSPEACLGRDLDERATVYSIGCLLYELLTGSVPFLGPTALETGNRHLKETALLLEDVRPDLRFPAPLQEILSKALHKESSERYSTILEMQHALKTIEVVDTPAVWVRPRRVHRDFKSPLPGHVSGQWNLISSAGTGIRKVSTSGTVGNQILWMCVLGCFAVLAIINAGNFLWLVPLLTAVLVRIIMYMVSASHFRGPVVSRQNEAKLSEKQLTK
ncbi:MAG: serine/threonine-protein kinase [Candidatus Obscuribacterales bacterium]|nr:serine/threonine-protein kinase [Candidatus Obscuribacterales bacterium]